MPIATAAITMNAPRSGSSNSNSPTMATADPIGKKPLEKWCIPEAHTDFLLAVIGEELGLIGVMVTILAFLWITRRAFQIGRQAIAMERTYAGLVAKGIALWIGCQAFINMGVNLGLLPTKGLTLPLMSYGGTGIMVNCLAIGMLLRIDRENRITMRGGKL
nr:hypothetical protein [Betaproteobacteria bacterium]